MWVEGRNRPAVETRIRPEVSHGKDELDTDGPTWSVGVRLIRAVTELKGKTVVFATLNPIQLLRHIGVRAVVGSKHFALAVPTKSKRIAEAVRKNFRGTAFVWINAPDTRGQFQFPAA